jgi:hypothetical protein
MAKKSAAGSRLMEKVWHFKRVRVIDNINKHGPESQPSGATWMHKRIWVRRDPLCEKLSFLKAAVM